VHTLRLGIVSWVLKRSGPPTQTVTEKAELDTQIANGNVVVGFFEKDSEGTRVERIQRRAVQSCCVRRVTS
jgi:hypothetical protein